MSPEGAPVFTFSFPGGWLAHCPPSVTPLALTHQRCAQQPQSSGRLLHSRLATRVSAAWPWTLVIDGFFRQIRQLHLIIYFKIGHKVVVARIVIHYYLQSLSFICFQQFESNKLSIEIRKINAKSFSTHLFFSLRHFGHLSHNSIKTRRNSINWSIFSIIMTELP